MEAHTPKEAYLNTTNAIARMQTARQARLFNKQCDGIGSGLTQWFGSPLGWLLAPATGALVFLFASDTMPHSLRGSSFSSLSNNITVISLSVAVRIFKHLTSIQMTGSASFFNKEVQRKMISTFKDTTGGDKLLNSSTFLEAERVLKGQ